MSARADKSLALRGVDVNPLLQEDKEACIYLNVDDPKDIARMIKFFYAERYTDESEKRDDVIEFSMLVHARMLALADKYQSPPLMDFAGFSLSYKAAETKTKKEDRVIFDQIIEEVPFVYSNTSCSEDKLRLLLVDGMHMTGPLEGHRGCLKEHGSKDDWLKIFQEVPEFGAELMSYSSQLFAAEEAERFDENDPWAVGG